MLTMIDELLAGRRMVICAGSGGVGKTTTAAAVALGLAEEGKKVAVVTIDRPERRNAVDHATSTALLEAIEEHRFDAAFGGARRDEERARAKERVLSFRDEFGQWDPRAQRPEVWNLYNGHLRQGEHVRVFPLSNWTELDVWH